MTTETARAAAERIVGGMHVVTGGDGPYLIDSIEAALTAAHAAGRLAMREEAAKVADGLSDAVQRAAYPQGKLAQVLPESNCYRRVAAAVRALKVEEG